MIALDIEQVLKTIFHQEFVLGVFVSTFVLVTSYVTYMKIKDRSKKDDKMYDKIEEMHQLTQTTLITLPQTLNDIVLKLNNINENLAKIITTVSVIDRNTTNPQVTLHMQSIMQQLTDLSKSIGALQNSIKLLEDRILTKLKMVEGADYDL